ncbi:hypothetical protein [Candidatus Mesenet endosymbiont of Agriotes lineatus]|uniref:hypothetical protein n=1 Tax=Candidatus Mesenet endosymbiont of Agriotes lineatus TaxID=3077948 RepID=UPI0030D17D64
MKTNFEKVAKKILLIPLYIVLLPFSAVLFLTRILLFPKFFFSLWHKERVEFSSVLGLFAPELLGKLNAISNFKAFLKMKNSNRDLLINLLKNDNLDTKDITYLYSQCPSVIEMLSELEVNRCLVVNNPFFVAGLNDRLQNGKYLELVTNLIIKITDRKKLKIIFDYLKLNDFEHLSTLERLIKINSRQLDKVHAINKACTHESFIEVINSASIGFLKFFCCFDESNRFYSSVLEGASRLSALSTNHDSLKALSFHLQNYPFKFEEKTKLEIEIIKAYLQTDSDDRYSYLPKKSLNTLVKLFSNDLIPTLCKNFKPDSDITSIFKYYTYRIMCEQECNKFISMIKDKDVIESLKLIDTRGAYKYNPSIFLMYLVDYDSCGIDKAHSLLANKKFIQKISGIDFCLFVRVQSLYQNKSKATDAVDEILALFDCLDSKRNKGVLDKLVSSFEIDHKANYSLLCDSWFGSRSLFYPDEMIKMISDTRFDETKIVEVLKNYSLFCTLIENDLIDGVSKKKRYSYMEEDGYIFEFEDIEEKVNCILEINYIIASFLKKGEAYFKQLIDAQRAEVFLKNISLFVLILRNSSQLCTVNETRSEYSITILPTIKNTKLEHFIDGKFVSDLKDKVDYYFNQLLNFDSTKILLSEIKGFGTNDELLNTIQDLLNDDTNVTKFIENMSNVKFMEFFTNGKYQEITQESLNKIQYLKIKDLPKTEKDKSYFQNQGITDEQDLHLLVNLAKESKTVISHIKYSANLQNNAMYTMHELFDDISIDVDLYNCRKSNNRKQSEPAKLLDLCKINIVRSALTMPN